MPAEIGSTFWAGKRVLVTGHTGFKGAWLTTWLCGSGARVHGVSLPSRAERPFLGDELKLNELTETRVDIASDDWIEDAREFSPDVVFHLAAQSLVSEGYRAPAETFRTNIQGTVQVMNLLAALGDLRCAIIITTDKVYDTRQPGPYQEAHYLGGPDPYSASKAAAELVVHSWPEIGAPVATARAGNVIGGGDWSPHRLVPDLLRAWSAQDELVLRRPSATRPWQHVLEPLAGYLAYAEALHGRSVPNALNFGPLSSDPVSVREFVQHAASVWTSLTGATPGWREASEPGMVETETLTLDASRAQEDLGLTERWDWRTAVTRTLEWHLAHEHGARPERLIVDQIRDYLGP